MVIISERPAEADDRAVPGHWEGDLIIGTGSRSAIATLVERPPAIVMLVALPDGRTADASPTRSPTDDRRAARPPAALADLGPGQRDGRPRRGSPIATGIPVYFCDPHSPWQRGSNENTNGLLRQYLPKGTDLSQSPKHDSTHIAIQTQRTTPQTLGWQTPAERLQPLLR